MQSFAQKCSSSSKEKGEYRNDEEEKTNAVERADSRDRAALELDQGEILGISKQLRRYLARLSELSQLSSHGRQDGRGATRGTEDNLETATGWDDERRVLIVKGYSMSVRSRSFDEKAQDIKLTCV